MIAVWFGMSAGLTAYSLIRWVGHYRMAKPGAGYWAMIVPVGILSTFLAGTIVFT